MGNNDIDIIVGRCLLLPSFWRETEGTDCTWISLPPNYDRGARGNQPLEDEVQHQPRPRWPMNKCYVKPFHMEPNTRMWFLNQCIEIHVLGMAKKKTLGPQPSASMTMTSFPRVASPFESPLESVCEIVARVAHRAIKGVKKDLKHQDEMSKCIVNPVV